MDAGYLNRLEAARDSAASFTTAATSTMLHSGELVQGTEVAMLLRLSKATIRSLLALSKDRPKRAATKAPRDKG